MKRLLLVLLAVMLLTDGALAQEAAPSRTERIVGGLLDFGAAVMRKQNAGTSNEKAPESVSDARAEENQNVAARLGESVGVLVQGVRDPGYVAERVAAVLKETGELVLREYLERYKAEGRAYTRELANIITERIVHHEKIASTLHSIRMLCWGVVIYLSVISLLIFFMLWQMKCTNEKVLKAIEELRRRQDTAG